MCVDALDVYMRAYVCACVLGFAKDSNLRLSSSHINDASHHLARTHAHIHNCYSRSSIKVLIPPRLSRAYSVDARMYMYTFKHTHTVTLSKKKKHLLFLYTKIRKLLEENTQFADLAR